MPGRMPAWLTRRGPRTRAHLGVRRCLACGYAGRFAQAAHTASAQGADHCPRCGCDFHARPPKSYAEMEGLDDERRPVADPAALERRMLERWLLFLFLAVVVLVFLGTLVGALATSLGFGSA